MAKEHLTESLEQHISTFVLTTLERHHNTMTLDELLYILGRGITDALYESLDPMGRNEFWALHKGLYRHIIDGIEEKAEDLTGWRS